MKHNWQQIFCTRTEIFQQWIFQYVQSLALWSNTCYNWIFHDITEKMYDFHKEWFFTILYEQESTKNLIVNGEIPCRNIFVWASGRSADILAYKAGSNRKKRSYFLQTVAPGIRLLLLTYPLTLHHCVPYSFKRVINVVYFDMRKGAVELSAASQETFYTAKSGPC